MSVKDVRYKRTEYLLSRSLFNLLEEKTFNEIKISELASKAGVSRQAFYSHYEDKYDFLNHLNSLLIMQIQHLLLVKMKKPQKVLLLMSALDQLTKDADFCLNLSRLFEVNQTIYEPNFDCLDKRLEKLFFTYFSDYIWKADCYCQTSYFQEFLGKMITNALYTTINSRSDIPLKILQTQLNLFDYRVSNKEIV
ncbi:TetR/AcrR family transcriptional regulator [uncultured Enterococcus sp.]|uniref:TetR/AcrR family transcriptional regulator n=1 Tax=uncultured Enterococcus sp. TaxID=167972 RepID=UPI002AA925A3|nr:TetR/AcrR family transcriptional regulator [uncultured Enterococcus sp.]